MILLFVADRQSQSLEFRYLAVYLILYILKFNIWLDILSVSNILILGLQFIVSYVVFMKIRDTENIAENGKA